LGYVHVKHIEGMQNVADIFTKEIKDVAHFRSMAFTLTSPQLLTNWDPDTGESRECLPREERGVLDVGKISISNLGGAKDLASHLGKSPVVVAAAAQAVASWAISLAKYCCRALH
jgi:hypothetical protein